jgi:hypothetical protein
MPKTNSSLEKHSSWCPLELNGGKRLKVSLLHIGRGKFRILDDEEGGKYIDKTVDASDIVNCLR